MGLAVNKIHQGDCIKKLGEISPGSVDLVFADPPFNIGYDYDVYDDRRTASDYQDWSRQWMAGVFEALSPSGTFWLAIGDEFAAELKVIAQDIGFSCRSWVIWYYTFGVNCRRGLSRSHTHLFHFVKDASDFTFNDANPAIRVPSARQLVYADARANPRGRLPDNTWILRPQDLPNGFAQNQDTWYFPRVAGTFKEREGFHGCQMPEQLLGRIIRLCSNPNDVVLDPFAGSGTTLAVARKLGRQWIGLELSKDYVKHIRARLKQTRVGDSLDGAENPLQSAPSTKNGKTRPAHRSGSNSRHSRSTKADKVRDEINRGVIKAYTATHDGHSTDYLLANPELNERFLAQCTELGTPGEPVTWNQTLLRVRKSGKLPRLSKPQRTISFREMDSYSFASEVAMHQLSVEFDVTLDGMLCDPEIAAVFDQTAYEYAPGHSPFEYRWAALSLRKRAKQAKRQATNCEQWLTKRLPQTKPLTRISEDLHEVPGVYALLGREGVCVYVGESFDLRGRLDQIRATDSWSELETVGVKLFPENESPLLGLKSVLIQRLNPALNSQLLFPKLEVAV